MFHVSFAGLWFSGPRCGNSTLRRNSSIYSGLKSTSGSGGQTSGEQSIHRRGSRWYGNQQNLNPFFNKTSLYFSSHLRVHASRRPLGRVLQRLDAPLRVEHPQLGGRGRLGDHDLGGSAFDPREMSLPFLRSTSAAALYGQIWRKLKEIDLRVLGRFILLDDVLSSAQGLFYGERKEDLVAEDVHSGWRLKNVLEHELNLFCP